MLHFMVFITRNGVTEYRVYDYENRKVLHMTREEVIGRLERGETIRNIKLEKGKDGYLIEQNGFLRLLRLVVDDSGNTKIFMVEDDVQHGMDVSDPYNKSLQHALDKDSICVYRDDNGYFEVAGYNGELTSGNIERPNMMGISNFNSKEPNEKMKPESKEIKLRNDRLNMLGVGYRIMGDGLISIVDENNIGSVKITDICDRVTPWAFYRIPSIESITVGGSVKTIEHNAFDACIGVNSLELTEGLKEIGDQAFANGGTIKSVVIPRSLERIGNEVFMGTKIGKILIPDTIQDIGYNVFEQGSSKMKIMTTKRVAVMILDRQKDKNLSKDNFIIMK